MPAVQGYEAGLAWGYGATRREKAAPAIDPFPHAGAALPSS